jgi:hypothetical protein
MKSHRLWSLVVWVEIHVCHLLFVNLTKRFNFKCFLTFLQVTSTFVCYWEN